jgi:hypothetical protein
VIEVDPFDLPDWLGEGEVTWTPEDGIHAMHLVAGRLSAPGSDALPCDLLAVDEAYPKPVADDELRHQAHRAWRHGQVLLVSENDRLTLAVPGTSFTAEGILEALARLAKAVGARAEGFSALLRLGD